MPWILCIFRHRAALLNEMMMGFNVDKNYSLIQERDWKKND